MTSTKPQRTLSMQGLLAIHKELQARYGGHSREVHEGELESALAKAVSFGNDRKRDVRARIAAGYAWGILSNHPFAEGNQRLALAAMVTLMEIYDLRWECSEVEETAMVQDAAAGKLKEAEWEAWVLSKIGKQQRGLAPSS